MPIQSNQIAISNRNKVAAIYIKKKLKELTISRSHYKIGNIYLGEVERLLPNINAAFIKLDKLEKNGFIQIDSLLPTKLKQKRTTTNYNFDIRTNILVQVLKEPTGNKGPTLSTNIGLIGEYLILLPFGEGVNISKQVYGQKEKASLRMLFTLLKPLSIGLLIKKEAYQINEYELVADYYNLKEKWTTICTRLNKCSSPSVLMKKPDFIHNVIKDFYNNTTTKISSDSRIEIWRIYNILIKNTDRRRPHKLLLEYYEKKLSLVKSFYLDKTIYATLQPRVNLVTGGYIIIEKTEALTAIDINSGSFSHIATSRSSLLWINCEAATEIGRQLKLRNIGGIIVVDFIDMNYQRDQMALLNHFNNVLKKDNGYTKIIQLSEIGLVELTRKRQGQNIYDIFGHRCSRCNGLGQSFHVSTIKSNRNIFCLESAQIYYETGLTILK